MTVRAESGNVTESSRSVVVSMVSGRRTLVLTCLLQDSVRLGR